MTRDLSMWSYLWDLTDPKYVLLRRHSSDFGEYHLIFNVRDRAILMIEDEALAAALETQMVAAGVPIVDTPPAGENPIHKVVKEMLAAGRSPKEINQRIRDMEEEMQRGAS